MQDQNQIQKSNEILDNNDYNNLLDNLQDYHKNSNSTSKDFMFTSDIYVFNEELQEIGEEVIKELLLKVTEQKKDNFSNTEYIKNFINKLKVLDPNFQIDYNQDTNIQKKISLITKYAEKIVMGCYKNIIFDEEIIKLNKLKDTNESFQNEEEGSLKNKYKILFMENGALNITNIIEILIKEILKEINIQKKILKKVSRFSKAQSIKEYQKTFEKIQNELNLFNDPYFKFTDIKTYIIVLRYIIISIITEFRDQNEGKGLESEIKNFISKKIKKILINKQIDDKVNEQLKKIVTDVGVNYNDVKKNNDKLLLKNITKEIIINKNEDIKNFLNNL